MSETQDLVVQEIKDVTIASIHSPRVLDADPINRIGEQLYTLIEKQDRRKLIIDFSDVQLLSSALLGVLINLRNKADAAKAEVVLCGLRPELRKVFKITKADKLFAFYDTEAEALHRFDVYMTHGT